MPSQPSWENAFVFGDIELAAPAGNLDSALVFTRDALEWTWRRPGGAPANDLQLLPGMHVDPASLPGFAALTWRVHTAPEDVPTLRLETSFMEALVTCRWSAFLQEAGAAASGLDQVAGSSAGDLVFGYTARSSGNVFGETLLANGFLEVKNLISWPRAVQFDPSRRELTLPAARQAAALDHVRHTIRILFNQHEVPADALEVSADDLVFRLAPGAHGSSWPSSSTSSST